MKKFSVLLSVLLILAMVLSGCGGNNDPVTPSSSSSSGAQQSNSPADNSPKTLTVWHSFTQENRAAFVEEMAEKYTSNNPNISFNIEIYPWATFDTKWKTGLNANALPDLSTALPEGVAMMGKANVLSPLNDMVAEMGNPFVQKPIDTLTVDGNILAVPFYVHARVMWYRKDILEKYSIPVPTTLDELLTAATKITQSGEMYGMAVPMGKNDFFGTIYLYITGKSMGANMITEEGRANLTSPEMINAIKYLAEMYKNASPEGAINYGDSDHANSFIQGKTAFFYESGFTINRIITGNPEIADKFGAMLPPAGEKGGKSGWFADYVNFVVWKGNNENIAKDFLKTFFSGDSYVKFLHLVPGGMIPSIKGVADSEEFLDNEIITKHKADIDIIVEGIENGCPLGADYGLVPAMNIIKTQGIIEEMLQAVVMGTMTAEEAAKTAEERLNAEIDKINK